MTFLKSLGKIPLVNILLLVTFFLVADRGQTSSTSTIAFNQKVPTTTSIFNSNINSKLRLVDRPWLIAQRQSKVALVIGNGNYDEAPLRNPVNDANDIAAALKRLGFELIDNRALLNLNKRQMDDAIDKFRERLRQGGVGVFYYAGHGVGIEGVNYLIPINADLDVKEDVEYEAFPLGRVINNMQAAKTQLNFIIVDACRNNPIYRQWPSAIRSDLTPKGLIRENPTRGTIIFYATRPGSTSIDGVKRNSPFTLHLLRHIEIPRLDIAFMIRQVTDGVVVETNNKQEPWREGSVRGYREFYLNPIEKPTSPLSPVSDPNLVNEGENLPREVPPSVKPRQGARVTAQRQQRIALVIGNGAYPEYPLNNPVNDATDVAKVLKELGFEVILLQNTDLEVMETAIKDFSRKLRQGGVAVFYYAGHGVQVNGENYLVPLKAKLNRQEDVRYEAVPLGKILNAMEDAQTQVNIVILDASRDNAFYRRWRSRSHGSLSVPGLAPVQSARGTLIIFATAPGEFAEDGEGQNSPFTSHLLRHIKTPNLPVELMFKKVRAAVVAETNREQTPWEQSSLVGEFSFNPISEQPTLPSSPPSTSPTTVATLISKATGVDYTKLRDLLAAEKWKEADQETTRAMLQTAGRENEGWLRTEDIEKFSCEDLRIIDQLWLDSSQGKFGFSVQKDIYQNLGGTREFVPEVWLNFGNQVGWRKEENWLQYKDLTFNLNASRGQLPLHYELALWEGSWGGRFLFSRVSVCNL